MISRLDATIKEGCKWRELVWVQTWVTICHSCRRSPWLGEVRTPLLTAPMGGPSPAGLPKAMPGRKLGPPSAESCRLVGGPMPGRSCGAWNAETAEHGKCS